MLRRTGAALILACSMLAGCLSDYKEVGEDKLQNVSEGMSRDSLFMLIGTGPLTAQYADTLRLEKGFRRDSYLIDGKVYDVVFYRELQGNVAESVVQEKETPIVVQNGKVLGWGWKFYVEAMDKLKLPSPLAPVPATNSTAPATPPAAPDSALPDSLKKPNA